VAKPRVGKLTSHDSITGKRRKLNGPVTSTQCRG